MTIEVDLSAVSEWAAAVPTLAYVAAAVATWYSLAGRVVRKAIDIHDADDFIAALIFWLFSPVVAAIMAVGVVMWPVSGGIIPPPWKWGRGKIQDGSGDGMMKFEINLGSAAEWLDSVPTWAFVVAGVLGYYFLAGFFTRWAWGELKAGEAGLRVLFWIYSPLFIAVLVVATILWVLSAGVVIPPWKWEGP